MKSMRTGVALTLLAAHVLAGASAGAASLQVDIQNSAPIVGRIHIALFDSAEAMAANKPVASKIVEANGDTARVTFDGLAEGSYAFSVFADENANGKLDTNLVGVPVERYGFSNDAMGFMGPPRFDAAAVRLGKDDRQIAITIKLRHYF